MSLSATHSRPPNAARRAEAAKRPNQYRERLVAAGAGLFVEHGIAGVSVEQLIAEAGVSRATFYGCFANKNELAAAILVPVFDSGKTALAAVGDLPPQHAAEALFDVYLQLWADHETALLLTSRLDGTVFSYLQRYHDSFNAELKKVLDIIESGNMLLTNSAGLTLVVLARTAIPLLQVYKDQDGFEQFYRDSMKGLILKRETM